MTTEPTATGELAAAPIAVSDDAVDDLRQRLRQTRWPERETVDDWSQGIPLDYVQALCATWRDDYDWRVVESELNRYEQLRFAGHGPTGEEVGIQVLHAPSPEPDAIPVVFTHGWPGSVVEFLDVIEPLRDPRAHGGDPADAVPRGLSDAARLRLQRQAGTPRLERRAHRRRVGSADDGARLRPLRRAGR